MNTNTVTTPPAILRPFGREQLRSLWSAVDAADDYAQGANDRRCAVIIPALQQAAWDLLFAVSGERPEALPQAPQPATLMLHGDPLRTGASQCRQEIFRQVEDTWRALAGAWSGQQTHTCLAHLLRLVTSLLGLIVLSLIWDHPTTR
jgi:hypothetical protein